MRRLSVLIMMITSFFIKADNIRLSSTPIKSNFKYSEILTLSDEKDGYYDNILSSIMPNGNYVVLDMGNKICFVYDNTGKKLITSFGKEGTGPGEFSFPRQLYTAKNRIIINDRGRTQLFDVNGKFINSINARWAQPMISEDGITFVSWDNPQVKNIKTTYDFNGKLIKETPNPNYEKEAAEQRRGFSPDMFKEMMTRPRQLTKFSDHYVRYYPGEYKFEVVDENLNPLKLVTKDFERMKEDPNEVAERWGRGGRGGDNKEAQKRRAQMMAQRNEITGGYLDDINSIAGVDNNHVFLRTASDKKNILNIDVISPDIKYIAKISIKGDEVLSANVANGKLFVNYTNEEIGPYAKVYQLNY